MTRIPNRKCPKCGNNCVGVIMEDAQQGYDKEGYFWEEFGVACSQCKWELQLRSSNS